VVVVILLLVVEAEELHLGRIVAVLMMLAEDLRHYMACLHRIACKTVVLHLSIHSLLVEAQQEVAAECILATVRLLQDVMGTCVLLEDDTSYSTLVMKILCFELIQILLLYRRGFDGKHCLSKPSVVFGEVARETINQDCCRYI
jgi:hypothetical protein